MIAIRKLLQVRTGLQKAGKRPKIRCLFIEKDRQSFEELECATSGVSDIEVKAIHGQFEELIPEALSFVGASFFYSNHPPRLGQLRRPRAP